MSSLAADFNVVVRGPLSVIRGWLEISLAVHYELGPTGHGPRANDKPGNGDE